MDRYVRISMVFLVAVLFACCDKGGLEVEKVTPSSFESGGSVMLDVTGKGFKEGARLYVGPEESSQVRVNSKSSIVALAPPDMGPGTFGIQVENPDGEKAQLSQAVTVSAKMNVHKVKPKSVQIGAENVKVLISGEGFTKGCKVHFGKVASPEVIFKDSSNLVAKVPRLGRGRHDIKVTNPEGGEAYLYNDFQVRSRRERAPINELETQRLDMPTKDAHQQGVAVADVNGNGLLDFFITSAPVPQLYINQGDGKFKDLFEDNDKKIKGVTYGAYFGDYDNDGFPDLLTMGKPPRLYRNVDGESFEDVSEKMGIDENAFSLSACWGDYNADGLLDLYLGSAKDDDYFYENKGDHFERVFIGATEKMTMARELGNDQPSTFSCAFADYDNDGHVDLFVGVRGQPSKLLHNEGGKGFKNVIESSGIVVSRDRGEQKKEIYNLDWGSAFADLNHDGFLDLLTVSGSGLTLYLNNKNGTFKDITDSSRLRAGQFSLCPAWGDFDNDGDLDVAISDNLSGARVYHNRGDGTFEDVTGKLGVKDSVSDPMGTVWADLNNDGALDLIMANFMGASEYYINTPYPGRHYLKVRLTGTRANRMGIGSRVRVFAGERSWTRHVSGGEGKNSQPPAVLHFGLGEMESIDRVEVTWPGGEKQTVKEVEVDSLLKITQPEKPPKASE